MTLNPPVSPPVRGLRHADDTLAGAAPRVLPLRYPREERKGGLSPEENVRSGPDG